MGPSHPATHGVLRLKQVIDGEEIVSCDPVIGYLHCGMEKIAENCHYNQYVAYTDRFDYLAPMSNNIAYAYEIALRLGKISVPILVNRLDIAPSQANYLTTKLVKEEIIPDLQNEAGEYIIF